MMRLAELNKQFLNLQFVIRSAWMNSSAGTRRALGWRELLSYRLTVSFLPLLFTIKPFGTNSQFERRLEEHLPKDGKEVYFRWTRSGGYGVLRKLQHSFRPDSAKREADSTVHQQRRQQRCPTGMTGKIWVLMSSQLVRYSQYIWSTLNYPFQSRYEQYKLR